MGMYQEIYLGAYIELEMRSYTVDHVTRSCPNGHRVTSPKQKFCSECGAEIVSTNNPIEELESYIDLVYGEDENSDGLLPVDIDDFRYINVDSSDKTWLIQNLTKGKYGTFLLDNLSLGGTVLENNPEMVANFTTEFEDFLIALQKQCKSVKVQYGLVHFYS